MARAGYCHHGIEGGCMQCIIEKEKLLKEAETFWDEKRSELKSLFLNLIKNDADFRKQIKEALEK
jgi:6-phosphogluconate dehydrogenase